MVAHRATCPSLGQLVVATSAVVVVVACCRVWQPLPLLPCCPLVRHVNKCSTRLSPLGRGMCLHQIRVHLCPPLLLKLPSMQVLVPLRSLACHTWDSPLSHRRICMCGDHIVPRRHTQYEGEYIRLYIKLSFVMMQSTKNKVQVCIKMTPTIYNM